ncbi:MAG: hypothetical protein ACYCV7_12485 [Acidimicrobiales bacterium]
MTVTLLALTAAEIAIFIGAVAIYLILVANSLQHSAATLAKVTFGVRAVESQCAPIGPTVTTINGQLGVIAGELGVLADLAGTMAPPANGNTALRSVDRLPPQG